MSRILALSFLVFLCVACSRSESDLTKALTVTDSDFDSAGIVVSPFDAGPENAKPIAMRIDVSGQLARKSDDFGIAAMQLYGDLLKLVVTYSGGCETHDFVVWTDNVLSQGQPPAITLFISHDSHRDPCEGLIERAIWIDLSPLQAEFLRVNPNQGSGAISIKLENNSERILYRF